MDDFLYQKHFPNGKTNISKSTVAQTWTNNPKQPEGIGMAKMPFCASAWIDGGNASATIVSSRRGWLVVVEGRAVEVRSADDIERCFEQGEDNEQPE